MGVGRKPPPLPPTNARSLSQHPACAFSSFPLCAAPRERLLNLILNQNTAPHTGGALGLDRTLGRAEGGNREEREKGGSSYIHEKKKWSTSATIEWC